MLSQRARSSSDAESDDDDNDDIAEREDEENREGGGEWNRDGFERGDRNASASVERATAVQPQNARTRDKVPCSDFIFPREEGWPTFDLKGRLSNRLSGQESTHASQKTTPLR